MQRKIENTSFLSEIIVSEKVALNCLYKEDKTCHRLSMCKQTVLRFCIALTETSFQLNYVYRDEQIR